MGTGQAAGRFLLWDVHRLDCLDVEVAVFDLARRYFGATWLDDPRVRALAEDGRDYIRHSQVRYDVIGIEVGQLFRPGIISFYTEDFYQRLRQRLGAGRSSDAIRASADAFYAASARHHRHLHQRFSAESALV